MNTFQQTAKIGVAGSFQNQLMSNNSSVPEVGKGATIMLYSDRRAYEVVSVNHRKNIVVLEELDAEYAGEKGTAMMGHQNWKFKPTGVTTVVQWRHNAWRQKSEKVVFTKEYSKKLTPKFYASEDYKKVFVNGEMLVVDGITEIKTEWNKVNILFGVKDYYYDWEF